VDRRRVENDVTTRKLPGAIPRWSRIGLAGPLPDAHMKRIPHPAEYGSEAPVIAPMFSTLGALTQREEEQLSRTFQACFNHSQGFRERVFAVLEQHCELPFKVGSKEAWFCDVEVATKDGKGRIDIRLRPSGEPGPRKTICIESKVKAPDKMEQLQRYRKMGTVVLLTKERPRIGERVLDIKGIQHFRWQDLHDALSNANGIKGKDRFLVEQFCHYLEDLEMASESKVSEEDVVDIGRLLNAVGNGFKLHGMIPRRGMEASLRWMNLTAEVAERLKEAHPGLAKARQWGPGYFSFDDDGGKHQALGVSFSRKPWSDDYVFSFRLMVCPSEEPWFDMGYWHGDFDKAKWVTCSLTRLIRNGYIDLDVVTKKVLDLAKKWKVVLK